MISPPPARGLRPGALLVSCLISVAGALVVLFVIGSASDTRHASAWALVQFLSGVWAGVLGANSPFLHGLVAGMPALVLGLADQQSVARALCGGRLVPSARCRAGSRGGHAIHAAAGRPDALDRSAGWSIGPLIRLVEPDRLQFLFDTRLQRLESRVARKHLGKRGVVQDGADPGKRSKFEQSFEQCHCLIDSAAPGENERRTRGGISSKSILRNGQCRDRRVRCRDSFLAMAQLQMSFGTQQVEEPGVLQADLLARDEREHLRTVTRGFG